MNENQGCAQKTAQSHDVKFETVRIAKTTTSCSLCENYAARQSSKPIAVICCEGACLRGEIARQAANLVCHQMAPEKTVRICMGGAFTKDTGQRNLVKNAKRVVAVEGCSILCATRTMQGVIDGLKPEVVLADKSCDFDQKLFGIDEMTEAEIKKCAQSVADKIVVGL